MRYMIVSGKPSPYEVTLINQDKSFAVDEYLTISDKANVKKGEKNKYLIIDGRKK
ncbi:MAG: hypothetical protein IJW55_10095 [Clostridia bacterium]|nr:hypothetical protein [Clostridia bacterium]MBQ7348298.1 hypothetical protein [Clostridia bacterium]